MKYYLIAGEASGDLHGSNLMAALKKSDQQAEFRFLGGDLMQSQGGSIVKHYKEMAFMGFIPVLLNLRTILRNLQVCKEDIQSYKPDAVILIDYPGFNLKIAEYVKTVLKIPVVYYISPKVWAWKEYRVKSFKKHVDKMLCILPFEVDFFKEHDYPVTYVGNPTVDAVEQYKQENQDDTEELFLTENNLQQKPVVALLAGSRKQEIKDNLPTMIEAFKPFHGKHQAVIAGAPGIDPEYYNEFANLRDSQFGDIAFPCAANRGLQDSDSQDRVVCVRTFFPHKVHLPCQPHRRQSGGEGAICQAFFEASPLRRNGSAIEQCRI